MSGLIMKSKEDEAEDVYHDAYRKFIDYMTDEDLRDLALREWNIRISHALNGEVYTKEYKDADSVLLWATWAEKIAEHQKQSFLETSE